MHVMYVNRLYISLELVSSKDLFVWKYSKFFNQSASAYIKKSQFVVCKKKYDFCPLSRKGVWLTDKTLMRT